MIHLINLITFLIPPLALLGGLSAGATVPLWLLAMLLKLRSSITLPKLSSLKLEGLLLGWTLLSCFWSPSLMLSFKYYIPLALGVAGYLVVKTSYQNSNDKFLPLTTPYLVLGMLLAAILFLLEYFTEGFIGGNFRLIIQNKEIFLLNMLDRGCSFLSCLAWVLIAILLLRKKYLTLAIFYFLVFMLLMVSDSLAAFVAFVAAGIVFGLGNLLGGRFLHLVTIGLIAGSLTMPICFYSFSPLDLSNKYDFLPLSAKHRIFIWSFTSHRMLEKPVLGHGFAYSKTLKLPGEEMVHYEGIELNPFSSHPHNNVLQVFLETGIIGLVLFLALIIKYLRQITYNFALGDRGEATIYAAFINYYIIGMISYNIWQWWWVCTAVFVALQFLLIKSSRPQEL